MNDPKLTAVEILEQHPKLFSKCVNDGQLADMCCPSCGERSRFKITATSRFTVFDHTVDEHADVEWDQDSSCMCGMCDHPGTVKDFTYPGLDREIDDHQGYCHQCRRTFDARLDDSAAPYLICPSCQASSGNK